MSLIIQYPHIDPELFSISLFGVEFALRWYALDLIIYGGASEVARIIVFPKTERLNIKLKARNCNFML